MTAPKMSFDFSSVDKLAADLAAVPAQASKNLKTAMRITAQHVKDDWRKEAELRNDSSARRYPYSIDYDVTSDNTSITAEIGPNRSRNKRQAFLGRILEGDVEGVRNAPQNNGRRALANNVDDFVRGIQKATEGLL